MSHDVRPSPPDNGKVKAESSEPVKTDPLTSSYVESLMRIVREHGGEVASRFIKSMPPPK